MARVEKAAGTVKVAIYLACVVTVNAALGLQSKVRSLAVPLTTEPLSLVRLEQLAESVETTETCGKVCEKNITAAIVPIMIENKATGIRILIAFLMQFDTPSFDGSCVKARFRSYILIVILRVKTSQALTKRMLAGRLIFRSETHRRRYLHHRYLQQGLPDLLSCRG